MKKWLLFAGAVLVALIAYTAIGPYRTVHAIREAIRNNDASALASQVDFPRLRGSLKAQLEDRIARGAGADMQSNPFGAIGLGIASSVIGSGVDMMITPSGLAAMMEGRNVWKRIAGGVAPDAAPAGEPLHDAVYRFESPSRFTATIRNRDGAPVVFVLDRHGLRWRLADIRLPFDPY